MSVPDEVRRDAERTGALVHKKLLEIMELQADIDNRLRGDQPTGADQRNGAIFDQEGGADRLDRVRFVD